MFEWLFKEYPAGTDIIPDASTVALHIVGGSLIAISFFAIGLVCVIMAGWNNEGKSRRKAILLTKLFGFFLISCSFARIIEVLCFFHNYSNMNAVMKCMTGIIALIALLYIPAVIKETVNHSKSPEQIGDEITTDLKKVNDGIEEVKKISKKLE